MFKRKELQTLKSRVAEERKFMQVVLGPRQVGKTTLIRQLVQQIAIPYHFVSADAVALYNSSWIEQQWETARFALRTQGTTEVLLVIDEVQKVENWSEIVKAQWDKDTFDGLNIKLILLGSARLMLQKGLSESLAGRFEVIPLTHWSFAEMNAAFGVSVEEFVWFGGYPGAVTLINDEERWRDYILNSLVETTLSKDILMLTRVDKPSLLRRLFELGCSYSGQILAYTKLLGQLQDAGNTTTLTHYVQLLDSAGLLSGLDRFANEIVRQRASIPKWQVQNSAFFSSLSGSNFQETYNNPTKWGRAVESAIGTHLVAATKQNPTIQLYYWREGNDEVDFVLKKGSKIIGIEVKSGISQAAKGMNAFQKKFNPDKILLVGNSGILWQDFLAADVNDLF